MKNKTLLFSCLIAVMSLGSMALNPSSPPTGMTGAPSEKTCSTEAGCHSGGAFSGTVILSGVPDTVLPNTTYTLTLTASVDGASAGGFQLTCLDGSNSACGTLTAGAGTNLANANSRQYIRQSSAKTYSGGSVSWTFTWKSPATLVGSSIRFYFASLAANGNGDTSGDNAISSSKGVVFKSTTSINDAVLSKKVNISPNPVGNVLNISIDDNTALTAQISLVDVAGRIVLKREISMSQSIDVSHLAKGMYVAQIKMDNKTTFKKVSLAGE